MKWGKTKLLRQAREKQAYWPELDLARVAAEEHGRGSQPIQEKIWEGLGSPRHTEPSVNGDILHHGV